MPKAIELLERKTDELLDVLESMARQHCHTDKDGMTDSGAITASAEALLLLNEHRRFRVKKDYGRMVCGYWPEHDPNVTPNPNVTGLAPEKEPK